MLGETKQAAESFAGNVGLMAYKVASQQQEIAEETLKETRQRFEEARAQQEGNAASERDSANDTTARLTQSESTESESDAQRGADQANGRGVNLDTEV